MTVKTMTIRLRGLFFIVLGIIIIWFLYLERTILTPFILGGIFAYIFNPIVNLLSHKFRIPRTLSIIFIYLIIISAIVILSLALTKRVIDESSELTTYFQNIIKTTKEDIRTLPDWLAPIADNTVSSLEKSKLISSPDVFSLFPKAISRIVSVFILLFSGFYFLKEGRSMVDKVLKIVPNEYKIDVEIIINKINRVFGGYLRGQLFLVFIVSLMLFIALSIVGVKFALILAIFSGFAEIVPLIGPIVAGGVAVIVVLVTGTNNFSLPPIHTALIIAIVYFVIRHFQDYFITPHVMGRITKIHPLLIFFSVLAGGHLFGILGFILAVPIAASIKILLEFFLDKINSKSKVQPTA